MAYVLGRLMGTDKVEVEFALHDAVMAALFRGYVVPDFLEEAVDKEAIISPEWVRRQLDELAPQYLYYAPDYPPDDEGAPPAALI